MKFLKVDGFNYIYEHEKFREEFEKTISEKKANGKYHKWLIRELAALDCKGYAALALPQFEYIKDPFKIKAIRYPHSKKNPRVLFFFLDDNNETIILLHAFLETSKSTNSDYRNALKIAYNRIMEIKGSLKNEK